MFRQSLLWYALATRLVTCAAEGTSTPPGASAASVVSNANATLGSSPGICIKIITGNGEANGGNLSVYVDSGQGYVQEARGRFSRGQVVLDKCYAIIVDLKISNSDTDAWAGIVMEFEVLNEILTGTVAQLFTGAQNHASMHKSSSQMGQDKSEIPRKSSFSEVSPDFDPVTTLSAGQVSENPLSAWLMVEAKIKYQQACSKLSLDAQKIQGKHLSSYSNDDLAREKKKVKNELKIYDQAFQSKFKRAPSRAEKEPMRNLYMYYKRLKQCISRKGRGGSGADSDSGNRQGAAAHGASSSEMGSAPGSRAGSHVSGRSMASGQSGVSLASGLTANSAEGASKAGGPAQPTAGSTGKQRFPSASSAQSSGAEEGASRLTAENLASLGSQERAELDEIKRKYAVHTFADGQKRLATIKSERKELRTKLDQFQKNFEQVHNRKIRYTKDIVAVQSEFKRYKDLKVDVAKIEKCLKLLPKN